MSGAARARWTLAAAAGISLAIAGALASMPACSSDDDDLTPDAEAIGTSYEDGPTLCDLFTAVGDPCPAVSKAACFPMCTTGGCFCSQTTDGPRWVCTTDFSCVPEAGPLEEGGTTSEDAGPNVDADANADADANTDANADANANADADADADADANTTDADADD